MTEASLKTLLDGGLYFEGPRWHTGGCGSSSSRIDVVEVETAGAGFP